MDRSGYTTDVAVVVLLLFIDVLLLSVTNFHLLWRPEIVFLAAGVVLAGIAWFYLCVRRVPGLGHMAGAGSVLVLFTNFAAVLNYILAGSLVLPLQDRVFDAEDRVLGMNWLALYQWVVSHPILDAACNFFYVSLGPEMILLFLLLEGLGLHSHAMAFRRWFIVSALITIACGILIPAGGAFAFYKLPIAQTTPCIIQVAALRDGTLRLIDLSNAQGLVAFPSFHAALAMFCAAAASKIKFLAIPGVIFNALIIFTALPVGGHYFVDALAGIALAVLVIVPAPALAWARRPAAEMLPVRQNSR